MSFGLKNAGSTYQRIVTRMFKDQLERNTDIYIDDMVVKRKEAQKHLEDLFEVFGVLRKHRLRLYFLKCAFNVGSGKFLGYTITRLQPLRNPIEVQSLMRMVVALNEFISRSIEPCKPFF